MNLNIDSSSYHFYYEQAVSKIDGVMDTNVVSEVSKP